MPTTNHSLSATIPSNWKEWKPPRRCRRLSGNLLWSRSFVTSFARFMVENNKNSGTWPAALFIFIYFLHLVFAFVFFFRFLSGTNLLMAGRDWAAVGNAGGVPSLEFRVASCEFRVRVDLNDPATCRWVFDFPFSIFQLCVCSFCVFPAICFYELTNWRVARGHA